MQFVRHPNKVFSEFESIASTTLRSTQHYGSSVKRGILAPAKLPGIKRRSTDLTQKCEFDDESNLATPSCEIECDSTQIRQLRNSTLKTESRRRSSVDSADPVVPIKREGKSPSVRFSTVEIRSYEQVLSDNPSVTSGPALGIGWEYDPSETQVIPVARYEKYSVAPYKNNEEMYLKRSERERLLRLRGYSQAEIAASVVEIKRLRKGAERRSLFFGRKKICDPCSGSSSLNLK